jgi:hypothetical protein
VSALVAFLLTGALAVAPTALAAQVRQAASAPYQGTLTASAMSIPNGTSITFSYSVPSAGVTSTNWAGIYEPGQTPGQVRSTTWQYAPDASGTVTFSTSSLDGVGNYVAYFLYDNGYQALAGPVSFAVTPGSLGPAPAFQKSLGNHLLAAPSGVATDAVGNVWVAESTNTLRIHCRDQSARDDVPLEGVCAGQMSRTAVPGLARRRPRETPGDVISGSLRGGVVRYGTAGP